MAEKSKIDTLLKSLKQRPQQLLFGQTLALVVGGFIGWREVFSDFGVYCNQEGVSVRSLTSFSGEFTTNPLFTPCFWGSVAFIIAFVWSVKILLNKKKKSQRESEKKLTWLLIGSVIFAWVNTAYTFYKYYSREAGTGHFGCPIEKIDNPLTTACFQGATAFLVVLVFALIYLKTTKKKR